MEFLRSLIVISEKAANVARACRREQHLFELLVQEKKPDELRALRDFKTLADVLIQEMVKHDLTRKFPALEGFVKGEEDNQFCNGLGETVTVEVKSNIEETAGLLKKVLNDDEIASNLLAEAVHKEIDFNELQIELPSDDIEIDYEDIAIWIDPIDCTNEYIRGEEKKMNEELHLLGLGCVTVLVGAFSRSTGRPVVGVINQPFHHMQDDEWRGNVFWGLNIPPNRLSSPSPQSDMPRTRIICVSVSENPSIKSRLVEKGFQLATSAGAGYKILAVVLGLADAYILSKNSTHKWDTCAPQAILTALGGDVLVYEDIKSGKRVPVKYPLIDERTNNCGGLIAYRDEEVLENIIDCIASVE